MLSITHQPSKGPLQASGLPRLSIESLTTTRDHDSLPSAVLRIITATITSTGTAVQRLEKKKRKEMTRSCAVYLVTSG